ncbi:glycine N-acyltransferase-like protein 3 isoform X1 [Hippocampus comes]|uniref:glycine N-acyltransferase-like protein 3 isoform X1 n=1 Tax=Hippocampus comes TaxID=109280 RepID=UPI00094E9325|nr:PREDICTED: glycine N-acyltransferase-like protein 3 isoform X1 [Hippocampus comes]
MKVLQKDEHMAAESVLLKHLPKSFQVYGYLHACNRNKQTNIQIVVDTWPDFKVIICRPDPENKQASDWRKKVTFYCLDEKMLRKMLLEEDAIDWSADFTFECFDNSHTGLLKEVSTQIQVSHTHLICAYQLYLPNSSHLVTPAFNSDINSRISSLDLSHAHLVNQTWKFGGDELGYKKIVRQISNFPSYCITDHQGQPVSWLLLHENLSLGMLYTLPEHRRKGYATVLVYTMAQRLLAEGYPVFTYVEEGNMVSFKMFKNLGFIDDPSVRRIWFKFAT